MRIIWKKKKTQDGHNQRGGEAAQRLGEGEWGDDQSGLEDLGGVAVDGANGQGMVALGKILLGHGRAVGVV
ncbi:hypothetical protein L3X38_041526 [Prunus dulcis]|uniref:Uncharacterized protein n=1 Tax=Prunus dulcis TaxID=3755 RepID=A0AAD4YL01_PRUDU|nr:hypothetical protein L3X38_041526 [Prunus dulcis]